MTRSSLRLRDRNCKKPKEKELRSSDIFEKAQRIERDVEDIRQHNKLYNCFIAKELKIDKPLV